MLSYEKARKLVLTNTQRLASEKIFFEEAAGYLLAEDIYSKIDMPPFNKSAVDGYAMMAEDTRTPSVRLKCIGLIQAGEEHKGKITSGQCVKIMTGAPLPGNTNSVVMIEDTAQSGAFVELLKSVQPGQNVCPRGEDIKRGQKVLKKGKRIFLADIAMLAAAGRQFVKVIAKPKVAVLNTGGEIIPVGSRLGKNKIYNANGPVLSALLKSDGIKEPQLLGIIKDDAGELKEAIEKGLHSNILLISGGVSMGDYDLVPSVLKETGVRELFHKVNIKPGRPLFFGKKGKTLVFGVPGNPVSNFLAYFIFIQPVLHKMSGLNGDLPEFEEGVLKKDFCSSAGRARFVLVKILKENNKYYLTPINSHGSADVAALSRSDGFMVVESAVAFIKRNDTVRFITWKIL